MRHISLAIAVISLLVIGSCKKTEDTPASRLFRPVISGQLQADSNTIMAAWQLIKGATSYQFELSRDTFKTIDLHLDLDTNAVVIKNLNYNQLYQIQVKAIAPDTVLNSKWSFLGSVKTLTSMLNVPDQLKNEISDAAVKVTWVQKGLDPTDIKIIKTSDSSVVKQVALTAGDVANKYRIVSGLQPSTKYTIFLYSGTTVRGWADFTTLAPESGTIVDLRGITGRPSILSDTIPFVVSGSKILLDRSLTYNISSSVSLGKSLTIKSGSDLSVTTQATIYFTSNFNFTAGAVIDSIEFNDVYMRSDNYTSRYVFNTTNGATVGKLKFINLKAEIFRGLVRLQSGTTTVNNFIVNNSILDSLANYGVLTVDNATCKADNISITNSTIYKVEKVIVSKQNSNSVLIDNCTFNEAPFGLTGTTYSYYVNYSTSPTNVVTNGITINNCIFGPGKPNVNGTAVRDVNVNASTTINASNNYRTSDHISGGNDLPNIITYTKTSTQLWQDPALGNFKIIDGSFPGKLNSGDPRWR
jgi:hypothetical protein